MLLSDALYRLLLASVCLCVCGNAIKDIQRTTGSPRLRSLRMVAQIENEAGALKNFRKTFGSLGEAVLERTPRDTMFGDARVSSSSGAPNPPGFTGGSSTLSWERESPDIPTPPEPFLPDIMPKEDNVDSLWTETLTPSGDTAAPPSQDEPTEGTMSSESLPLIFEPVEESGAQLPSTATSPLGVDAETGEPSRTPPTTADAKRPYPVGHLELAHVSTTADPDTQYHFCFFETEHYGKPPRRSNTVPFSTGKTIVCFSDMDEAENSDESPEDDENEADPTESSQTQAPYSLIPPPPVWVQRNQGLMRSWVALIREKAGYVSGMLAPVAIGMMGALILVGALYSIRRIQRRRRNSFKRQRSKVQPAEQTSETRPGRQDQAMLLADSSEDEF
ncbi:armadillo-like helical domain-containing protein 4 isoform X2 [Corythoichthys intestinalis]|uniref:armadillo-like helical domain-containing protein 4 isoform X2 n=1 Tax=Corythoichthys intestinalis TaxID=161448 RepID=UPI0025A52812|nr:armadillo-like helical domain-containing protein 4 isoform X2 [Corythoichthys intestinalis]